MGGSKRRRQRMSRSAGWLITVTVLIVAFLSLRMISLMKTEREYADKEKEVSSAYESELQKSEALEESAAYIKSTKYVEDEAMAKLHLGYPETTANETIGQAEEAAQAGSGEQAEPEAQSNAGAQSDAEAQQASGTQPNAEAQQAAEAQPDAEAQQAAEAQPDAEAQQAADVQAEQLVQGVGQINE